MLVGASVQAPPSVCFELWNDWARLVDDLDLVSQVLLMKNIFFSLGLCSLAGVKPAGVDVCLQIGLDADEPDMGLFQCFYRWGEWYTSG